MLKGQRLRAGEERNGESRGISGTTTHSARQDEDREELGEMQMRRLSGDFGAHSAVVGVRRRWCEKVPLVWAEGPTSSRRPGQTGSGARPALTRPPAVARETQSRPQWSGQLMALFLPSVASNVSLPAHCRPLVWAIILASLGLSPERLHFCDRLLARLAFSQAPAGPMDLGLSLGRR